MRLAIAIFSAAMLVPAGLLAQMHAGGGHMGGGGFHGASGGFAVRGGAGSHGFSPGAVHGFAPAPRGFSPGPRSFAQRGGLIARGGFTRFGDDRFHRRFDGDFDFDDGFGFRHNRRFFFTTGFGYAYYPYAYSYPAYYDYADYSPRNYDAYADTASANQVNDAYAQGALQQQVADLEGEVQQMRAELRAPPQAAPTPSARATDAPPVTLVFRDGRRVEASNYAIAGNTFWIVNQRTARKVAMSDLDLPATRRVNEQNGVELDWLRGR